MRKPMILFGIFLALLGFTFGLSGFMREMKKPEETRLMPPIESTPPSPSLTIDPNAAVPTASPMEDPEEVAFPGVFEMTIAANQTEVKADFHNPAENENYYLTYELFVPTGEGRLKPVYKSGLVPPGQGIEKMSLNQPISAGTYENCILFVQPYQVDDLTPANNMRWVITLIAE